MSKDKWFKFFPSDFLAGIHNLEQIEVTAYIIVLCELYDNGGSCQRDDIEMARRCRMRKPTFTKALDGLIAKQKIDCFHGRLSNRRVSKEMENRVKQAADKAAQREHGRNMGGTRTEHEQGRKPNKNNENWARVQPYKEERNKNTSSSLVPYVQGGSGEKITPTPALLRSLSKRPH